jgi:hypothetical protein
LKNEEFTKFDRMMDKLLKVPHSEIKEKLDAEKSEKQKRRSKRKRNDKPK